MGRDERSIPDVGPGDVEQPKKPAPAARRNEEWARGASSGRADAGGQEQALTFLQISSRAVGDEKTGLTRRGHPLDPPRLISPEVWDDQVSMSRRHSTSANRRKQRSGRRATASRGGEESLLAFAAWHVTTLYKSLSST